ncbi:hypothetical protein ACRFNT_30710, partial [Klebsiella michiganensis]
RNFNQRVSLGRNDLLIRTFLRFLIAAAISIPITYILSIYLYKHVEVKGIAIGRKVLKPKGSGMKEVA